MRNGSQERKGVNAIGLSTWKTSLVTNTRRAGDTKYAEARRRTDREDHYVWRKHFAGHRHSCA
jgi:hypothetical protein